MPFDGWRSAPGVHPEDAAATNAIIDPMASSEMTSADLARRLLGRELIPDGDRPFVDAVRASLRRHRCARGDGSYRPRYLVSEEMARQVAQDLRIAYRA